MSAARRDGSPGTARRLVLGVVLAVAGLLTLRFLTASDGYPALLAQRHELGTLQHEVEALHRHNDALRRNITALRSDPHAVEKIAREELDLVAPGEVLYLFPEEMSRAEVQEP